MKPHLIHVDEIELEVLESLTKARRGSQYTRILVVRVDRDAASDSVTISRLKPVEGSSASMPRPKKAKKGRS